MRSRFFRHSSSNALFGIPKRSFSSSSKTTVCQPPTSVRSHSTDVQHIVASDKEGIVFSPSAHLYHGQAGAWIDKLVQVLHVVLIRLLLWS
jgi:hypothetical protein